MKHFKATAIALALLSWNSGPALAQTVVAPKDGTIAFALTSLFWANYQTPEGRGECPQGFNDGNREQFKQLYPEDGQTRQFEKTQLKREIDSWYPTTAAESFVFREAVGPTALGLNLDGKIGPRDFTSPEGEPGIDNQMFRALGCIQNYRGPIGAIAYFEDEMVIRDMYNRVLIELTGVTSLVDSDDVKVTIYRGRDPLLLDAGGKHVVPGGTQRIDMRWGAKYIQHLRGKIVDGVLTTEPADIIIPWGVFYLPTDQFMRSAQLRIKLTPTSAEGLLGGYTDVETWYLHMMKSWSTHHQSYGQTAAPSLYKALRRLADAYPDPKSGANTAISSAMQVKFSQVVILPASKAELAALGSKNSPQSAPIPYAGAPHPRAPVEEESSGSHVAAAKADSR